MPINVIVLRARLEDAEAKYHDLLVNGGVKTVVDQNGERIEFTNQNARMFAAYILTLKHQLGDTSPGPLMVFL